MSSPKRTCRTCGNMFDLTPTKPGNINDCINCAVEVVTPFRAMVSYPSKNASEVEITITQDVKAANRFNRSQRHHWCSVS